MLNPQIRAIGQSFGCTGVTLLLVHWGWVINPLDGALFCLTLAAPIFVVDMVMSYRSMRVKRSHANGSQ